jgi:predicted acylesterase/phospholipase RssA
MYAHATFQFVLIVDDKLFAIGCHHPLQVLWLANNTSLYLWQEDGILRDSFIYSDCQRNPLADIYHYSFFHNTVEPFESCSDLLGEPTMMKPMSNLLLLVLWLFQTQQVTGFLSSKATKTPHFHSLALFSTKKEAYHVRFLNKVGLRRARADNRSKKLDHKAKKVVEKFNVTSLEELDDYWDDTQQRFRKKNGEIDYTTLIRSVNVVGDTQIIGTPDYTHPVAKLLHERKRAGNKNNDGCKIALAVEGGGMRGCISAGMVAAIGYLNLTDGFDIVYGSSAGTVIGSYLITGQLPWFGPEVYYDCLPTAGREFINPRRLLRAIGFGLLDPRLIKDVVTRPGGGKPVLNLSFLLKRCLQELKPLDWKTFVSKQKVQPLNIVASGCKSEKAVVMNMENGGFTNLAELSGAMHASCLLPGLAGPLINIDKRVIEGDNVDTKFVFGNSLNTGEHYEPLADALLYEPLPYRTAVANGATHVLATRTRPDGTDVTGSGGFFEKLIFRRFFLRKNRLPHIFSRLKRQLHKKLYAEDVIRLNENAYSERAYDDTSQPHLMAMAMPPGSAEISRLETGREAIFQGIRRGFARAYDCLVEDPAERGRGAEVAKIVFPDEILDYDPLSIDASQESAFSIYLRKSGIVPRAWQDNNPYAVKVQSLARSQSQKPI